MDAAAPSLPRNLFGWLPFLWSRVLFAGPSSALEARGASEGDAANPRLRFGLVIPRSRLELVFPRSRFGLLCSRLALLIVLPGLLLYPCLGFRLFEPDESRYAQIPSEMLQRGELVVPTLQGEPYLDKPPLMYWAVMLSYRICGVHDWAARLVPALAVHATLLLVYLLGRRTLGEPSAWWGALILTLAPAFVGMARLLILDGLLTLWITLAVFTAFEAVRGSSLHPGWWLISAVACGLGVLTKGPVAVLLLAPPLWLHNRLAAQGVRPGWRGWGLYAGVVFALALPWYLALAVRVPGFVSYFFWEQNVQRFLAPGIHVRSVWFYLPVLGVLLMPGILLGLSALRFLTTADEAVARLRSPELGFHLLAGGWCVLFFTLSACKLPTYILPALPFLSLVLGHVLAHGSWSQSRLPACLATAAFAVMVLVHYLAVPWYAAYRSPMSRPAEVLEICSEPNAPLVCYPRNCDSIAYYLGRDDLRTFRSKDIEDLRTLVRTQPRTVILCTHRHSLEGLKQLLPPEVRIVHEVRMGLAAIPGVPHWLMKPLAKLMGETALGLSDLAVVEGPPSRSPSVNPVKPAPARQSDHHVHAERR